MGWRLLTFDQSFPYAKHLEEVRDGLIYSNITGPCLVCGYPTHFIEINYQAYFCSDGCIDKIDQEACSR